MSLPIKPAKTIKEALKQANFMMISDIAILPESINLKINFTYDITKNKVISFDRKSYNSKYLPTRIYDTIDFVAQQNGYPKSLMTLKQSGKVVKRYDFGDEVSNKFLEKYISITKYGLRQEDVEDMTNEDLEFVFEKIYKRKIKVG